MRLALSTFRRPFSSCQLSSIPVRRTFLFARQTTPERIGTVLYRTVCGEQSIPILDYLSYAQHTVD